MFFFNALSNSFCSDVKSGTLIAAGMLRILETKKQFITKVRYISKNQKQMIIEAILTLQEECRGQNNEICTYIVN